MLHEWNVMHLPWPFRQGLEQLMLFCLKPLNCHPPFLNIYVRVHYPNLNSYNSWMLWNTDISLVSFLRRQSADYWRSGIILIRLKINFRHFYIISAVQWTDREWMMCDTVPDVSIKSMNYLAGQFVSINVKCRYSQGDVVWYALPWFLIEHSMA